MTKQDVATVLLKQCYDATEAHIIRGILETNNIQCFLLDEHHNNIAFHLNFALGGVRVMVFKEDLEKSEIILKEQLVENKPDNSKIEFEKRSFGMNFILGIFGIFSGAPLYLPKKAKKE